MDYYLLEKLANSSAHRKSRDEISQFVMGNTQFFPELMEYVMNTGDPNHHKACWILELILEERLHLISNELESFCNNLSRISNPSALRSVSKIVLFLSQQAMLTKQQEDIIIENCLDWLIQEKVKVATKAYSIRALFELGKKQAWVHPELKRILNDDYKKYSAGYKAVAREILKKIK